ncbi:hypothetical protein D3C79_444110 [compost metagenome]
MRLNFQLGQTLGQLDGVGGQNALINQHPGALDMRQHWQQRHFNLIEHRQQLGAFFQLRPHRQMQLQRDIGIFSRVRRRLLQSNLVEGELLFALTGDLFKGNGFMAEIAIGQTVHVVATAHAVQHIGFQHGVEGNAAQGDVVTRQQTHIKLQVLTDLQRFLVFQQRFQRCQHISAIQLRRRIEIVMRHRQISGFARRNGKGQADQVGGQGIQTVGFGIEGKYFGVFQLFEPISESLLIQYGDVTFLRQRRFRSHFWGVCHYAGRFRRTDRFRAGAFFAFQPDAGFNIRQPTFEFVLFEQLLQRVNVQRRDFEFCAGKIQLDIGFNRRQLIGEIRHLFVLFQLGCHGLGATEVERGDVVQVGIECIQPTKPL